MKNYALKKSEEKNFITKFDIDPTTDEIVITYADEQTTRMPNNNKNKIILLNRMRNQVEYYRNFENDAKDEIRALRISQILEITFAIIATILVAFFGVKAFTLGWKGLLLTPLIFACGIGVVGARVAFESVSRDIDRLKERIRDFKKSMFFLRQEKVFANERLLRKDVKRKTPHHVQSLIEKAKEEDIEDEVPIINFNNIEHISAHDLEKTYKASLQSQGPVLTLKPIDKK